SYGFHFLGLLQSRGRGFVLAQRRGEGPTVPRSATCETRRAHERESSASLTGWSPERWPRTAAPASAVPSTPTSPAMIQSDRYRSEIVVFQDLDELSDELPFRGRLSLIAP